MTNPLIGMPQGLEWLVILAIVVLVFGAAKLPDLARSSGQALRIFKTETKSLRDDDDEKTPEQREIEARNEAQREVRHDASGEVLRERRDDTTA
ncbi:twin-arginine translocase TatA/TatE family subunit [Nocardioides sp. S-58]|uniref:Sec-independent protein translocase protein TatA n=1 Tax=Nocardioides renjunii TaxID=3095075 RepID=A0ABU5KAS1_9ACTN|nr:MULTISPECIES: twin-arginine translocase TatA/TatE family subunit [unclassified Nocardioides]MDZ5662070.1 twin-arginine translocase TatA/TatE family subunit [Nocardioides sp. S-58]WQQ24309.1 twin-arginine translocase TatA/TatE family subunit [Nocardioides sp. S-34]